MVSGKRRAPRSADHAAVRAHSKPARNAAVSGGDDAFDRVGPAVRRLNHHAKMETVMSKRFALIASAAILAFAATAPAPLYAQMSEKTVNVGGAPMYPSKNIIQNAVNS
jgi:hypothetical protein